MTGAELERAAVTAAYQQRWDEALELLEKAAAHGDPLARGQLDILDGRRPTDLLEPPAPDRITEKSAVYVCAGFAPSGFASWFIERARSRLVVPLVQDAASVGGRVDPARDARHCILDTNTRDVLTAIMQERAARLARVPLSGHEAPSVICYERGQKYDFHYDFLDPTKPELAAFMRRHGQRVVTIVTYLNDDFEGAQTDFPRLGIGFRGKPGDAVAFSNVLADGSPDYDTLHAGLPPKSGTKWVLSQWLRSKPQPPA